MHIHITKHIMDQLKTRKKIDWEKAKIFIEDLFVKMLKDKNTKKKHLDWKVYKLMLGNEKIVYSNEYKNEYTLITYIVRTEYDRIEYEILRILKKK